MKSSICATNTVTKWGVGFLGKDMKVFDTEEEAADFFDKTAGSEAHGKEHWCDLYNDYVWEIHNE